MAVVAAAAAIRYREIHANVTEEDADDAPGGASVPLRDGIEGSHFHIGSRYPGVQSITSSANPE
jgi:hypothetical protein